MKINKRLIAFVLVILVLALISVIYPSLKHTGKSINIQYEKEKNTLVRVVDGDTIELEDNKVVRLLGINTPEKNMPYSELGKNFLQQFVGKTIYTQRDKEDTDKYGRKLRYIFYEDRLLNLEIIENGFANAYMTKGLIYEQEFLNAENQARDFESGIWQNSEDSCSNCITLSNLDLKRDSFILTNTCSFDCNLSVWFVKDSGRNIMNLSIIPAKQERFFQSKPGVWNDDGDEFFLFDSEGRLVLFERY